MTENSKGELEAEMHDDQINQVVSEAANFIFELCGEDEQSIVLASIGLAEHCIDCFELTNEQGLSRWSFAPPSSASPEPSP